MRTLQVGARFPLADAPPLGDPLHVLIDLDVQGVGDDRLSATAA